MGHLINPISFRVGFFGYWLDNWSPWQYYAYAEMLHQNLVLRDLLKEFLDGEFLRKASFFYSHFTIQYYEQKRFVIKIYYYDGLTEQVVQCVSAYWAKWAMKRNRLYKRKIRRFKFVKKTFVKDNLLFWWRYVDYNFASKIIWFLFLMMTLSFEKKNRRSRGRRHYNYRWHKKRLKFLKRKRFLFTIDQYLKLLKRLRFNKRRFNFFKKIFFFYYRANFKRLWYTFLLRDPHFEVFLFLRVFFMLFFKYIRFAYYKRRFLNRTLLYKRIKKKFNQETDSIVNLFKYNRFARKIINPAHMGVHPNFFMQHPYIPKKFKLKNRKLAIILKNFRWMWHYYFIHKHKGLKHYRLRLKYRYGDRVPYYIYNLPKRFFFSKRFLNKKIRFLRAQGKLKNLSYSKFYRTFLKIKKKRRRRFFLDERKISNINRFYNKYIHHLRFIILGGSKRIAANYYDMRWKFKNIKYKSVKSGFFVQLRYKQKVYRFLTNNLTLLRRLRKNYKERYFVFRKYSRTRGRGFIRYLVRRRYISRRSWKLKREQRFIRSFKPKLRSLQNLQTEIFQKKPIIQFDLNIKKKKQYDRFAFLDKIVTKPTMFRTYIGKGYSLQQRDFKYKKMFNYLKQNWVNARKKSFFALKNKKFMYYFYNNYMRKIFIKIRSLKDVRLTSSKYMWVYRNLLNKKLNFFKFFKKSLVQRQLSLKKFQSKGVNKFIAIQKKNLFKANLNVSKTERKGDYVLFPFKKYFSDLKLKSKYRCFILLYKFIFMRRYVYRFGIASYIQLVKALEVKKNLKMKQILKLKFKNKVKFLRFRKLKLKKFNFNLRKRKKIKFSLYFSYKHFLSKSDFYRNVFAKQINMRKFLYKTDLLFVRKQAKNYKAELLKKRLIGDFRRPFRHQEEETYKNSFGYAKKYKVIRQQALMGLSFLKQKSSKSSPKDYYLHLSSIYTTQNDLKKKLSLLNWRFLIMFCFKTNKNLFYHICTFLKITRKFSIFSINSYYWVIMVLWFWILLIRKRLNSLKIKKLRTFVKCFMRYNRYRARRVLKEKKRGMWLDKYNKNFFSRKKKSYKNAYDFFWLKKFRFGLTDEKNNIALGPLNFYLKQKALFQKFHLRKSLLNLIRLKKKFKSDVVFFQSKTKNSVNQFNWSYVNLRFNFLMKLLFWKENVQYSHLVAITDLMFLKSKLNLTFYKTNLIGLSKKKKQILQLNFFFKIKTKLYYMYKSICSGSKVKLNPLGNVLKFKYLLRKYKIILEKLNGNQNFVYRSKKNALFYKWYHIGRISHQKVLRRRLYRHLMKISKYDHSDIYVTRLEVPSNKWCNFSLYKKFYKRMRMVSVKKTNFYSKRLVFLRSYWLYGLFSYYFVQRRAQFLYILNRERKAVDLIEPLYVYFSHYRVTDIICRRLVMGFVRSLLVMERFRIQFMYFEQHFIDLCKNHVLYPFIVRFYGIDNDIVTAVFIARYIAAKLEYKFSVWELFKPIGKDLKIVSRGTKMLLGYKLQFIGRLKRRDRLRYVYNMGGSLPLSKHDAFIEHGYFTGILKNGKCSVRVWIYRHKSFSDFFFNYLYVLY